tara:strand:- start:309 stop:461 length:153 start_codon:yes stop_codon:yes gene_type:complete
LQIIRTIFQVQHKDILVVLAHRLGKEVAAVVPVDQVILVVLQVVVMVVLV